MRSPFINDSKYGLYEALIGESWIIIDLWSPLLPQVRGMRGYRLRDFDGKIVKQFTINPSL